MPPTTMLVITFVVLALQGLMWLCAFNDFGIAYWESSQDELVTHGWLAERYLGPVYVMFRSIRDIYAGLLGDWWGWPPNVWIIIMISGFASAFTWTIILSFADKHDIVPRLFSRLPFLPFTQVRTIRFYPDHLQVGGKRLPYHSGLSNFRLEVPDRIRDGRGGTRVLYGHQVIVYDNGASRHPVTTFAFAKHAADVQNALGVILAWWDGNRTAYAGDSGQMQVDTSDRFVSPD